MVAGELLDELPRFDDLFRIQPRGRLVEDEHVGVVDEGLGEADTLLVALGQLAAEPVAHVVDARPFHDLLQALAAFAARDALDLGDELEILDDAHVRVERRRFRKVAGPALGVNRLVEDVEPGDNGFAVGGRHVAGQNPHRRRLAGAVGSEEPEDFAALDSEADVVDGSHAAVAFGEVLNLDHGEAPINVCEGLRVGGFEPPPNKNANPNRLVLCSGRPNLITNLMEASCLSTSDRRPRISR